MEKESRPNVILIILDAVRADHLSCYGYFRKTSPNIDKIAKQGILYENAFSTAEWSPPSHASIFTGKYPSYHGTIGKNMFLENRNTTIAEILRSIGYETIGITSNKLIASTNGFDKGFERYISLMDFFPSMTSKKAFIHNGVKFFKQCPKDFFRTLVEGWDRFTFRNIETIKKLLNSYSRKKPFFLFTNFMNCHATYNPPRKFKKKFCRICNKSRFFFIDLVLEHIFHTTSEKINDRCLNIKKLRRIASDEGQFAFMAKELYVSEKEWDIIKAWYDGEIAYLDYRFGQLIDFLSYKGILDDTLLIITSDHGDSFGEHGFASHHFNLYNSIIHVPLIVYYPRIIPKGRRIKSPVSTIDIFPTILNILNIKKYTSDIQGRSLYPFKENQKVHDFVCAECGKSVRSATSHIYHFKKFSEKIQQYDKGLKCLINENYKYILSSDQKEELYDLRNDPYEEKNIVRKYAEKARELRRKLQNTINVSYFGPEDFPRRPGSKEMLNRLKALGYI